MFENLYDVSEQAHVHFVGCITDRARYDFSIVFTTHFFGKPLVICMQTGRTALLCTDDVQNIEYVKQSFQIKDQRDAEDISLFLKSRLPALEVLDQY